MKHLLLALLTLVSLGGYAQGNSSIAKQMGKITLSPYIHPDEVIGETTKKVLVDKLNQVVTLNGCAGEGYDGRFVITAHIVPLEESTTATVPVMTAVNLGVTIYIGDGPDGLLFSSWYTEVKGVGDTREDAWKAAIKKISPRNPQLVAEVETGKRKVVEYFTAQGPSIIAKARGLADGYKYEEAISLLATIPSICSVYNQAQDLIGEIAEYAVDNANMEIINQARAAWSASPDENGAFEAQDILGQIQNPSSKIISSAKSLTDEISSRLKEVSDRQFAFEKQQAKWAHEKELWEHEETINAQNNATKIAIAASNNYTKRYVAAAGAVKAYYNSRPRVVYHRWW